MFESIYGYVGVSKSIYGNAGMPELYLEMRVCELTEESVGVSVSIYGSVVCPRPYMGRWACPSPHIETRRV